MTTHKGIVTKVSGHKATIRIAPEASECRGCAISAMCRKEEEIEVPCPDATPQLIGTQVTIEARAGMQRKGILLLFLLPILLLIASLAIMYGLGYADTLAALVGIAAVSLWYIILYVTRIRLNHGAEFRIIKR